MEYHYQTPSMTKNWIIAIDADEEKIVTMRRQMHVMAAVPSVERFLLAFSSNEHHGQAERNTTRLPNSETHTEDDIPNTEHASLDRTRTAVRSIVQQRYNNY